MKRTQDRRGFVSDGTTPARRKMDTVQAPPAEGLVGQQQVLRYAGELHQLWLAERRLRQELESRLWEAQEARREKERLIEELRAKEEHINLLLKATIEAHEQAHQRICLDIHDGVAQTLVPAFQYLQALESMPEGETAHAKHLIHRATALIRQALREIREVISSLRPATLDHLGLVATLRNELYEMQRQTGWEITFLADEARWPPEVETALYRIAHEALNNAQKHSSTDRIRVELKQTADSVLLEVADWGIGFSPLLLSSKPSRRHGIGLWGMRKRAELLGGHCQITTAPDQGTQVQVEVPLIALEDNNGANNSSNRG